MADNNASKAKAMTKSAVYQEIANSTKLTRKQVSEVFDALTKLVTRELGKKGPGSFTLPGLARMKLKRKPATKARKGKNPFTGEEIMIKAKPAHNVVKMYPVKALKETIK
jgi:nucleoid DNA-binding protein